MQFLSYNTCRRHTPIGVLTFFVLLMVVQVQPATPPRIRVHFDAYLPPDLLLDALGAASATLSRFPIPHDSIAETVVVLHAEEANHFLDDASGVAFLHDFTVAVLGQHCVGSDAGGCANDELPSISARDSAEAAKLLAHLRNVLVGNAFGKAQAQVLHVEWEVGVRRLIDGDSAETDDGFTHDDSSSDDAPYWMPSRRQLLQSRGPSSTPHVSPIDALQAERLWEAYPDSQGQNIRVGIIDTGLSPRNPHFDRTRVAACMSFTNEKSKDVSRQWCADGHGHGTFGASLIAGGTSSSEAANVGRMSSRRPSTGGCRQADIDGVKDPASPLHSKFGGGVGLAPKANVYIFKVFTDRQVSSTSWFIAAFNVALQLQLDLINFSFGGMDYYDTAFLEKVRELAAAGVTMVTASGNDGPRQGSVYNPADQAEVVAVGSCDGPDPTRVSPFSSRGMTTWELPFGAGRPRPDVVSFGETVVGASSVVSRRTCRVLSGTSMAAPVVTGALAMIGSYIYGVFPDAPAGSRSSPRLNVALLKQILVQSADPLTAPRDDGSGGVSTEMLRQFGQFSQGAGVVNVTRALRWVSDVITNRGAHAPLYERLLRLTAVPAVLLGIPRDTAATLPVWCRAHRKNSALLLDGLPECREAFLTTQYAVHAWPWSLQALFLGSSPLLFNVTLYNSRHESSVLDSVRIDIDNASAWWTGGGESVLLSSEAAAALIHVEVAADSAMRAHVGYLSVSIFARRELPEGVEHVRVRGSIHVSYRREPVPSYAVDPSRVAVSVPFICDVGRTPPRHRRLLWDSTKQLAFPATYTPRDNIRDVAAAATGEFADWGADHPWTNYYALYEYLTDTLGYVVDVVAHPDYLLKGASWMPGDGSPSNCRDNRSSASWHLQASVLDQYAVLLHVDPEDYFEPWYVEHVAASVKHRGLQLVVLSDWYNEGVMRQVEFQDPTSGVYYKPTSGGSTPAAVNALLAPFGVVLSDTCVVSGNLRGWQDGYEVQYGRLDSAGCVHTVTNSDVNSASWVCQPSSSAPKVHDDVEEIQQLFTAAKDRRTNRAAASRDVWLEGAHVPPVFAFVLYDTAESQRERKASSSSPVSEHKRRRFIPILDKQKDDGVVNQDRDHAAVLDGGGVFVFTDSDCFDAMHHYTAGGLRSGHEYCFAFFREALRVLQRRTNLGDTADSGVSPLRANCVSVPRDAEPIKMNEAKDRLRITIPFGPPPNRTFEVASATPAVRRSDPLYGSSRRYAIEYNSSAPQPVCVPFVSEHGSLARISSPFSERVRMELFVRALNQRWLDAVIGLAPLDGAVSPHMPAGVSKDLMRLHENRRGRARVNWFFFAVIVLLVSFTVFRSSRLRVFVMQTVLSRFAKFKKPPCPRPLDLLTTPEAIVVSAGGSTVRARGVVAPV